MSAEADLIDLHADIEDDRAFAHLRTPGVRLVPGFGSYRPDVMVVGDTPGATETAHGRPFSGANGMILQQLMALAGLYTGEWYDGGISQESNAWLTYTIKYRVAGHPTVGESMHARPYLRQEWRILGRPRVIVTVGSLAWETLGRVEFGGINRNAGQPIPLRGNTTLWPMLHPAAGMANEAEQPRIERHWEHLGDWLRTEL